MSNLRLDTLRPVVVAIGRRQRNEPTTGTPNLRWSVARIDALKVSLADRRLSAVDIAHAYGATVEEIVNLTHELALPVRNSKSQ